MGPATCKELSLNVNSHMDGIKCFPLEVGPGCSKLPITKWSARKDNLCINLFKEAGCWELDERLELR